MDLRNNLFTEIAPGLLNLYQLTSLQLQSNRIEALDIKLAALECLVDIGLAANPLS